jgi:YfiH family protein
MSSLPLITPEWSVAPRVRAVMTTRLGGVSVAPWDSLNLGVHVGDNIANVLENRARVREEARLPAEPVWLDQVHGTTVVDLDAFGVADNRSSRGDAAVTRRRGVVCAIQVADCMPVLFAARDGSVVGAAHAGWRGLAGGVLAGTVEAMRVPGAEIVAWLGPAIGPDTFEVGDDVVEAFVQSASTAQRAQTVAAFTRRSNGKWLCDLYALARLRLNALGITQVSGGTWCTVADAQRFFSYRRDGQTGRMAALIWLASTATAGR